MKKSNYVYKLVFAYIFFYKFIFFFFLFKCFINVEKQLLHNEKMKKLKDQQIQPTLHDITEITNNSTTDTNPHLIPPTYNYNYYSNLLICQNKNN